MPVDFRCPHCGQMVSAPDEAAGTLGACAFCGGAVQAPGPGAYSSFGAPVRNPTAATGVLNIGDVLSDAWKLTQAHWKPLVLAALVLCAVMYGPMFAAAFSMAVLSAGSRGAAATAPSVSAMAAAIGMMYAGLFLAMPLQYGIMVMGSDLLAAGSTSVGRVFSGYRRFGRIVGSALLMALAMLPVYAVSLAGFFFAAAHRSALALGITLALGAAMTPILVYVGLGFCLAPMEVLDRGAYPVEALRASWAAVNGHRLELLGTLLLLGLIGGLGAYACYVGILFTLPFSLVGQVIVYRNLRGLAREGEDLYAG